MTLDNKLAIIVQVGNAFSAYSEDAYFICSWATYDSCHRYVEAQGFCVVSLNSRCGRTILDKLNNERV